MNPFEERMSRRRFFAGAAAAAMAAAAAACRPHLGSGDATARGSRSPSALRWPAEWEPHEATLMAMPFRPALYGRRLDDCRREWAAVAGAIARFEPVKMVVSPGTDGQVRELLDPRIDLMPLRYDDGWIRDSGPIFLSNGSVLTGLDWGFNGWGGAWDRYWSDWSADDSLPVAVCRKLDIPSRTIPMVLEGGAVQCDGGRTVITTEECLLNPNRNPTMTKGKIEDALKSNFNARKVIWLPYGLLGDLTSGHVDGVCVFIGPGKVLAQTDVADPEERRRLAANLVVLRSETDAEGRPLEVAEFPLLPRAHFAGGPLTSHSYINFGFADGGLVVPLSGLDREDTQALEGLRDLFPDREVAGVPTPTMTWAGGGVHCVTQQVPAPAA